MESMKKVFYLGTAICTAMALRKLAMNEDVLAAIYLALGILLVAASSTRKDPPSR